MIRSLALLSMCVSAMAGSGALGSWDLSFASRTVWFSGAAYCDKDTYLTRTWTGPTSGFQATKVLYDRRTDTNGYVGYLPSTNEIYVVYRGSQTLKNWITNLQFAKADYAYPFCNGCLVHKGFYEAHDTILNDMLSEVARLSKAKGTKKVVATGHSLGAALSTLSALDLKRYGYDVTAYNIGSPRVGNEQFFSYTLSKLSDFHRVVHNDDMVPHMPLQSMGFNHVAYEYFENESGVVTKCNASGEDDKCSNQYRLAQTSVDAHSIYLGIPVSCEQVSTSEEAELHKLYLERLDNEMRLEARFETVGIEQA